MSNQNKIPLVRACRVCRDVNITNEISFDSESNNWLQLYEFCFQITVTSDDTPRNMCKECARKIQDFTDFKNLALMSDKFWKSTDFLNCIPNNDNKHAIFNEEINFVHIPLYKNDDSATEYKHNELIQNDDEMFEYDDNISNEIIFKEETTENVKSQCKDQTIKEQCDGKVSRKAVKEHCQNRKKKISARSSKHLPEAPNLTCGICELVKDTNKMNQHLTEHNLNNDLNCRICKFVGRDFADMVTHRYDHYPKKYRINMKCYICDKKYLAKLALQFHFRSVHLNKKGGICTQCGKQFTAYKVWRNHEKSHVTENYKCDLCGRKFLYQHALKTHNMINHSEVKGYVCDICGRGFKRNSNLKLHLQTAHDSNKVTCDHCNGIFKNQKSLKAHLQRVTKEKTFQCEVCSKYFDTPNMLKRHMVWHGDERPYVCSMCGLSYKSTSQLNIHMRKHTGVMPFKCDQCTKSYPTSNQLREHMSNHSGERRYKCVYCPKSFHQKKLMVKHCSKRHSDCEFAADAQKYTSPVMITNDI